MDKGSIVIVTSTLYKNWYSGDVTEEYKVDKVRGDLALEMIAKASKYGFQIVAGNSDAFLENLNKFKINLINDKEGTFGSNRRKAYGVASKLPNVKVIVWTEPEKSNLINDSLIKACEVIENGTADIVVPRRSKETMKSLPPFQKESEEIGNKQIQEMTNPDLDIFFGPKIFSTRSDIVNLFLEKFEYKEESKNTKDSDLEKWLNAISFPVISALVKNYKVLSYEVDYVHPKSQTEIEEGNPLFNEKRIIQRENLIEGIRELLKYYSNNKASSILIETGSVEID